MRPKTAAPAAPPRTDFADRESDLRFALDSALAERDQARDELAAHLAKREAPEARAAAVLSVLERLVHAFPELATSLASMPQQRALRAARAMLADAGRPLP